MMGNGREDGGGCEEDWRADLLQPLMMHAVRWFWEILSHLFIEGYFCIQ